MNNMHETQVKLLKLARSYNLAELSLRKISALVGLGDDNARLVQHHIDQLVKKGFLWIDRRSGEMRLLSEENDKNLLRIPIMGAADCGPAVQLADDRIEGYLSIAPSLLGLKPSKRYFAIRAVGSSMNRAKIRTFGGQKTGIHDGDLVIAENIIPSNLDAKPYIVAVIDGLANIKKLILGDGVACLESESTMKYMPIYLEPDVDNIIAGEVVGVVKG